MDNKAKFEQFKEQYSHLEGGELIAAARKEFGEGELVSFSSFGAYSSLLLDLVAKVNSSIAVLFLETGKHFKETLEYVEIVKQELGIKNIIKLYPDEKILNNADENGDLWQINVDRCCWIRKVEPLDRYMKENPQVKVIITGRRSYQTANRSEMEKIEIDDHGRIRINPIAFWSKDKIIEEFNTRKLPQHTLFHAGYPSIGCAPCTKQVHPGEDERSGRWAHIVDIKPDGSTSQKTECGIHLNNEEIKNWVI